MRTEELRASIETMWRDPEARSRNRHFERFRDPRAAYARRVVLYLLELRTGLRSLPVGSVEVTELDDHGTVRLAYRDEQLGFSRTIVLHDHEFRLVAECPIVAARLRRELPEGR